MRYSKRLVEFVSIAGVAGLFVCGPAQAGIVANFDGGAVDTVPGATGNGWVGGWTAAHSAASSLTSAPSLGTEFPINGSGNYLAVARSGGNTSSSGGGTAVGRGFSSFDGADPAAKHRIEFDFRFDGSMSQFAGSFDDRLAIFADVDAARPASGATNSWAVAVAAANNGTSNVIPQALSWFVFDAGNVSSDPGNAGYTSFTGANLRDTGIALNINTIYHFIIDVDPTTKKYDVSLSANGGTPVVLTGNDFRNNSTAAPDNLYFSSVANSGNDNHAFAVDNISITPEPGTLGLLGAALAAVCARRRRSA